MKVNHDQFMPTLFFGFEFDKSGKQIVYQKWINAINEAQWRPVPMIELTPDRKACVAGYQEDDDD